MTSFLDLFSGAGGLSLGLRQAGWAPLLAVDNWPDAIATYRANFPGDKAVCADVADLDAHRLASLLDGEPEWVVGGPPCQGFSTIGRREREDPRNALVREFARVVRILRPRGFLIENVLGVRDMRFVGDICELFAGLGYTVNATPSTPLS